jgi:hypothetical protein
LTEDPEQIINEILDDLVPTFETLEARSLAVLRFLKDKGFATENELRPFLDEAANSSEVEWRAARLRLHHLFMLAFQAAQKSAEDAAKRARESEEESSEQNRKDRARRASNDTASEIKPEKPSHADDQDDQGNPMDDPELDRESKSMKDSRGKKNGPNPEQTQNAA